MKGLILGRGEVGRALYEVLSPHHETYILDRKDNASDIHTVDILHIAFPFSPEFVTHTRAYISRFHPQYTVIHSTVPVGTTSDLAHVKVIHSPIRGIHPKLADGIRTFVKFLGGPEASEVADYFRKANIKVMLFDRYETTEALKLFDTEYYRTVIEFAHRVKRYCDKNKLNFHEVYTLGNQTYNDGYTQLGHPEYVRPVLQPIMKPIGGHCLIPNQALLKLSE